MLYYFVHDIIKYEWTVLLYLLLTIKTLVFCAAAAAAVVVRCVFVDAHTVEIRLVHEYLYI